MEQLRIKITKCDNLSYWYSNGVGQEIDCLRIDDKNGANITSDVVNEIEGTEGNLGGGYVATGDYEVLDSKPEASYQVIYKKGRFKEIITPDGGRISHIVPDSISLQADHMDLKAGLRRLKLEVYIKESDIINL